MADSKYDLEDRLLEALRVGRSALSVFRGAGRHQVLAAQGTTA